MGALGAVWWLLVALAVLLILLGLTGWGDGGRRYRGRHRRPRPLEPNRTTTGRL